MKVTLGCFCFIFHQCSISEKNGPKQCKTVFFVCKKSRFLALDTTFEREVGFLVSIAYEYLHILKVNLQMYFLIFFFFLRVWNLKSKINWKKYSKPNYYLVRQTRAFNLFRQVCEGWSHRRITVPTCSHYVISVDSVWSRINKHRLP